MSLKEIVSNKVFAILISYKSNFFVFLEFRRQSAHIFLGFKARKHLSLFSAAVMSYELLTFTTSKATVSCLKYTIIFLLSQQPADEHTVVQRKSWLQLDIWPLIDWSMIADQLDRYLIRYHIQTVKYDSCDIR